MEEKKGPGGAPTKYKPEYCKQAFRLCLLGSNNEQLAEFFEVDVSTIKLWRDTHEEFSRSIKEGRDDADAKVAHALYKRALGYKHNDNHISSYEGMVTVTPIIKHYPPSEQAAIFWLTNRKQSTWKKRKEEGPDAGDEVPGNDNDFVLRIIEPKDE